MRIVILGATGQIGKYIVGQLKQDYPNAEIIGCSRMQLDSYLYFRPFEDNWKRLGKMDVLINAIGIIASTPELSFQKAHEGLTTLILRNRKNIGQPRVIQLSALGADSASPLPFLNTKASADLLLLAEPNGVVVRPSIVCTPGTVIVQKLKLLNKVSKTFGGYLPFPSAILKTKIQPVLGEDVAAVVSKLCKSERTGIVEIAGPEEISIQELINTLSRKIKIIPMNKRTADLSIRILSKILPTLINRSQYDLLFTDNTSDKNSAEIILGKPLRSTMTFWENELR